MPDIVITEFMDEAAVAALAASHDVLYDPKLVDDPTRLASLVGEARALIVRNRTQARGALLEAARRLACIGRLGVGLDNIDVAACQARGIAVHPATGANDLSVAEYVISTAMILLRGAYFSSAEVAAGAWPRNRLMGRELSGKTLGLIGYGAIARETARRADALGMHVIAHDPFVPAEASWAPATRADFSAVLAGADVVSLHVPLTNETRGMIGAAALACMKKDAVLINAARGSVIDEAALAEALKAGLLGGAALDVFDEEPLSTTAGARFAGIPNLILTPHIAGVTVESNVRVSWVIAEAVRKHLAEA